MKCKVKRDLENKLVTVINPDTGQVDSLFNNILSKVTKDPQSYIDADPFIRSLYDQNLLIDKTKEEVALGIWAKVHQYWINTGTSPIERVKETSPVQVEVSKPTSQKIDFQEEPTSGYRNRTIKNASADATIAIAVDFNSAGERLTKSSVLSQKKTYIPIDANKLEVTKERVDKIVEVLNSVNKQSSSVTSIPQNLVSGIESFGTKQEANAEAKRLLGNNPHSIDMIEASLRTRTTRSVGEMQKYNVKVGDIVTQFGKSADGTTKQILTKITAIHLKGTPGFFGTWSKEGWTQEGVEAIKRFKDGAAAIEFEIVNPSITLNIAGNGIYTMKGKYTQQQVDDFTYELLKAVIESPNLKTNIESIRTGGQTGFDEAGAKAGIRLGLPTLVLAPKGWTFRDESGKDISNEVQFKARFNEVSQHDDIIINETSPYSHIVLGEDPIFYDPSQLRSMGNNSLEQGLNSIQSSIDYKKQQDRLGRAAVGKMMSDLISEGSIIQNRKTKVLYAVDEVNSQHLKGEALLNYLEDGLSPSKFVTLNITPIEIIGNKVVLGNVDKIHPEFNINEQIFLEYYALVGEFKNWVDNPSIVNDIFTEYDDIIEGFESFTTHKELNKRIENNIAFFNQRLASLKSQKRNLKKGDSEANTKLDKTIAKYELLKEQALEELKKAQALDGINGLENLAYRKLAEFEELLNIDEIPTESLRYLYDNIRFWLAVGKIDAQSEHILFEADEMNPELSQRLANIGAKANVLSQILHNKIMDRMVDVVRNNASGITGNIEELLKKTSDIGFWYENMHSIGEYGDALLSTIQMLQKEAVSGALLRIDTLIKQFEEAYSKVKDRLGSNYDLLRQRTVDGKFTNRLVFRFSPEFFMQSERARSKFKISPSTKRYEEFAKWMQDNELLMNPIILFPTKKGDDYHWGQSSNMYEEYDEGLKNKHIEELKNTLGEKDFQLYMDRLKENLERFVFQYLEEKSRIERLGDLTEKQKEVMLKDWELERSPYYWAQKITRGKVLENSEGVVVKNKGYEYIVQVPRRYFADGSETGYYDKNYESIQNDPELAEFYEQLLDITSQLSEMLPYEKRKELGINGLPFFRKDIAELFAKGDFVGMSSELMDKFVELTRSRSYDDIDGSDRDPITGKIRYKPTLHLNTGEEEIKRLSKLKLTRFHIENPDYYKGMSKAEKKLSEDRLKAQFRLEAMNDLQEERSEDLSTTIKAYIMATVMYRHKANIEDIMNIMSQVADQRGAYVVKDGVLQKDSDGNYIVSGNAERKISALQHNMQAFFTGMVNKEQGVGKKKIYTSKEKHKIKEIEALIENNERKFNSGQITAEAYKNNKESLESILSELGGFRSASKVGNQALRFVQLKGLGWNLFAALNNMGFGYIANSSEAAAGKHFDDKALALARKLLTSSVLTNASFNSVRNGTSRKIRALFEKFDVLKDASTEMYKSSTRSPIISRFKWLNPYQLTKRTEYLNQGQTFLAYLIHKKVTDKNGNEYSLLDAFDESGNWDTENFGEMSLKDFSKHKTDIDQLIKRLHGNYDELSPIKVKESIEGRAIMQFKTWFPEAWRKYFGKETPDYILGDVYKGRYLTLRDVALRDDRIQTLGEVFKEMLKRYLNVTSFGLVKSFQDPDSFSHLSEVDALNMRRNIHQFIIWLNLAAIYYFLKYLKEDDEDDKISTMVANLTIHQITRLTSELELYASPTELSQFMKNLLPISVLVKDGHEILSAVSKTVGGDYIMQSGIYEGWYRIPKEVSESLPIIAPAMRYYSTAKGSSPSLEKTIIESAIGE